MIMDCKDASCSSVKRSDMAFMLSNQTRLILILATTAYCPLVSTKTSNTWSTIRKSLKITSSCDLCRQAHRALFPTKAARPYEVFTTPSKRPVSPFAMTSTKEQGMHCMGSTRREGARSKPLQPKPKGRGLGIWPVCTAGQRRQ